MGQWSIFGTEVKVDELREAIRATEAALRLATAVQSLEGAELDELQRLLRESLAHLRRAQRKLESAK